MRTSVSTRTSAIAPVPLRAVRYLEVGTRAKGLPQRPVNVHGSSLEVEIHGLTDELGERLVVSPSELVQLGPLSLRQVDLRPLRRHITRSIQHVGVPLAPEDAQELEGPASCKDVLNEPAPGRARDVLEWLVCGAGGVALRPRLGARGPAGAGPARLPPAHVPAAGQ